MMRQAAIPISAAIFMSLSPAAHAGLLNKQGGTMGLAPDAAWAVPMKDSEMAKLRGGMGGLSFSVFFTGSVTDLTTPPSTNLPTTVGDVTVSSGTVDVSGFVANTGTLNGVFQFTNVNGDMNVVNNHMTIQIAVFPPGSPTLSTLQVFGVPAQ